jgi:hypothetical protein
MGREAGFDGELYNLLVQYRQHAGKTGADGAGVGIRLCPESRGAAAKDF